MAQLSSWALADQRQVRLASRDSVNVTKGGAVDSDTAVGHEADRFDEAEMDKMIRQIVDKVRGNYLQNGESGRGIPAEVKRIIESSLDRV